jgi:hypothetical protein
VLCEENNREALHIWSSTNVGIRCLPETRGLGYAKCLGTRTIGHLTLLPPYPLPAGKKLRRPAFTFSMENHIIREQAPGTYIKASVASACQCGAEEGGAEADHDVEGGEEPGPVLTEHGELTQGRLARDIAVLEVPGQARECPV